MNNNLFEISQEEKNRIRGLHESYINKPGTKLIWEQTDKIALSKLNEKINSIILSQTNLYKSQLIVQLDMDESGEIVLSFYRSKNPTDKKSFRIPTKNTDVFNALQFDAVKLSNFYPTIFADPDLKTLYDTNESIRQQMDNAVIKLVVTPDISVPFNVTIEKLNNDRKQRKSRRYVKGDRTTFDNFYKNAGALFGVTRKLIFSVEAAGMSVKLQEIRINDTGDVPPTPPPPVADSFEFVLEDNFIFNTITLTPEGVRKYNEKKYELGSFLKKISRLQTTPGNTTVSDILNTDVKIYGYASIDGDPNENVTNGREIYEPCRGSGNGSRKDYNMCLSQKRAEYIANDLNNFIGEITLPDGDTILSRFGNNTVKNWAVGIGEGETSQFSGKKWPGTKGDTKATAPDRRVVFTPKLVANIKG